MSAAHLWSLIFLTLCLLISVWLSLCASAMLITAAHAWLGRARRRFRMWRYWRRHPAGPLPEWAPRTGRDVR